MDAVESIEPPILQALRDIAESDAEAVAEFLRTLGLLGRKSSRAKPLFLPAETLLAIGLALRLRAWELNGVTVHVDAGLPSASQLFAFIRQFLSGLELQVVVDRLSACLVLIYHDNFAWAGISEMGTDVQVIASDDETLVEQMAQFIWENRNALTVGEIDE
ncbi:MAG: hypothetical protein K8R36_17990 [Planctomycetales bacterium]|nr:hypothetical protein [Planctomycetales bacterium]